MQPMARGRRCGFSVVELLVVIAIISVLAAMLLPTLEQAVEQSRRVVCASNLRQIYAGALFYSQDFSGQLPHPPNTTIEWFGNAGGAEYWLTQAYYNMSTPPYNPSGWWAFLAATDCMNVGLNGGWTRQAKAAYLKGTVVACPSMDLPIIYSGGVEHVGLSYSYRWNGQAAPVTRAMDAGDYAGKVLFSESCQYRLPGGSYEVYAESAAINNCMKRRWAHMDGGNMNTHDGAVRFVPNAIVASSPYKGWPTASNMAPEDAFDTLIRR